MTAPAKAETCAACHGELAAWTVHVGDVVYCSAYCRDHAPGDVMAEAGASASPSREPAAELSNVLQELGPDELRVLLAIARRLAVGRVQYGALDIRGDRRDWRKEAMEEACDLSVYMACELLRKG